MEKKRKMKRKYVIDWKKTSKNLYLLRKDNITLRKRVCKELALHLEECSENCDECRYEMDNSISRAELAEVFNVSESVINNWERNKTMVSYEDLLFYCQLADVSIDEVVVFEE